MIALLLVLMAGSVGVSADGSDPLDPSDGGADWDGDGLTHAEEPAHGPAPTPKGPNPLGDFFPLDIFLRPIFRKKKRLRHHFRSKTLVKT